MNRMELRDKGLLPADGPLYRALALGDLPGAWLLVSPLLEPGRVEGLNVFTVFNCGLCLFRLEEYEQALTLLKRAERLLSSADGLNAAERKLFVQAVETTDVELLPLDPEWGSGMERYALIRVRWLTALCLLRLGRGQEAAPIVRFLAQYQICLSQRADGTNHAQY